MKTKVYVLVWSFALIGFVACKSKKQATDAAAEEHELLEAAEEAPIEQSLKEVGDRLLRAIQGENDALDGFAPDVAFAKVLAPKETKDLSDQAIEDQLLSGLKSRLASNIETLANDAKNKRIDVESLIVESITEEPSTDPPLVPRVVSIKLSNKEWKASVPLTFVKHEGRIYVFEILNSVDIFKPLN